MSTSVDKTVKATNRQARKTVFVYFAIVLFCIIFDKVYALFSHGVSSASMSFLFLYPLFGGAVPFLLLWLFVPRASETKAYRLSYNCYNSGIAALTVQSMLNGVFEIAGTSSKYLTAFTLAGWAMVTAGTFLFLIHVCRKGT